MCLQHSTENKKFYSWSLVSLTRGLTCIMIDVPRYFIIIAVAVE